MKIPILRHGNILMTAFQDDLTDRDVLQLQDDLLGQIKTTGATSILRDVSAMDTIDSYQSKMINDIARMAKILGCDVTLCGIQPKVAVSLIELGEVMSGMRHSLNVEDAIRDIEASQEQGA